MATTTDSRAISKPSKWFSNKSLKLSFPGRRSSKSSPKSPLSPTSAPVGPISPRWTSREDELREVFRYFDGDGDGKISASELRAYFGSIGEYMSHEEAEAVIKDLDADGDSLLDFEDFLQLMSRGGGDDEDLKKAFEMFELEKGVITPRSLQRMLHRLGDTKSYNECVTMIQVFDTDGNGVVDFNEFHRMMA
ncbi:PREDICTED: calcium-binding [Prunus dulcis]|uniref:PREDICTED: calcium-binding n=1 Tax=Prunus dulcis TaxID=3755 RepID=A0A5E4E218_PRUDU|nr:probable calcium-binding protein CML41 [Prunus dulcis]VVA09655.1 PREDICTED: calcium-binding [Prunus dulcis]